MNPLVREIIPPRCIASILDGISSTIALYELTSNHIDSNVVAAVYAHSTIRLCLL